MDESCFQQLLTSAPSSHFRALSLSSSLPHAGDWLNVVPSSSLGLHLHDREFRCCLRYWLGVPLHSTPYPCPECRCTADPYGDHQVGCGGNGDRIARHNAIRDVIFSAAQFAALAPSKEAPGLVPGSHARPADVFLPSWSLGRPAALDVHVISPLQVLTVAEAALTPGPLAMLYKLVSNASLPPTSQPAVLLVLISSPWWLRHLEALPRTPSLPSPTSAGPSLIGHPPQILPPLLAISLAAWP